MKMALKPMVTLALTFACHAVAETDHLERYGDGNYACTKSLPANSPLKTAVDAAVLIFPAKYLLNAEGTMIAAKSNSLCPGNQVAPADRPRIPPPTCSGTMITNSRVVTAAHCLDVVPWIVDSGHLDVTQVKVLSSYTQPLVATNKAAPISAENVRSIAKVLYCRWDSNSDLAVLELNAPMKVSPAQRSAHPPQLGEAAHLISFPLGLPLTISTCIGTKGACVQATVTQVTDTAFRSPLDSFRGSSGAFVANNNGEIIGIFRGGPPQLIMADPSTCYADIVHSDSCAGDLASRIDVLPAELFDDSKSLADVACVFLKDGADYDPHCPASDDVAKILPLVKPAKALTGAQVTNCLDSG